MKRKFFSVTLIATSLLLVIGVFGCSDDKDDKGGYVSCEAAETFMEQCSAQFEEEWDACTNDACWDAVAAKENACIMPKICGGANEEECSMYYATTCGYGDVD